MRFTGAALRHLRSGYRCIRGDGHPSPPAFCVPSTNAQSIGSCDCCPIACSSVRRQLLFPFNDNYFSRSTTTTSFSKTNFSSMLVLAGAEDKALQGCTLSADSGARPERGGHCSAPRRLSGNSLGWQESDKSRRSGGRASLKSDFFLKRFLSASIPQVLPLRRRRDCSQAPDGGQLQFANL